MFKYNNGIIKKLNYGRALILYSVPGKKYTTRSVLDPALTSISNTVLYRTQPSTSITARGAFTSRGMSPGSTQ